MPTPDPSRTPAGRVLARSAFAIDAATLARQLLGTLLVRCIDGHRLAGIIVETEAYIGITDRASHAFGGRRTPRNEPMYGPPGTAYVYFTYGMHHCMNIVCSEVNDPQAVLIRALRPTEGLEHMAARRGPAAANPVHLCNGPGKLCQALTIDRALNQADVTRSGSLFIESSGVKPGRIIAAPRVGIDSAGPRWAGRLLRWYIADDPCVSIRRR